MRLLFFLTSMLFFVSAWANFSSESLTKTIPGSKAYYRMNNFKAVLPGILYRGGSSQYHAPLSINTQQALCNNNFDIAVYLYDREWKKPSHPLQCGKGQLNYIMRRWNRPEEVHDVLEKIYEFINSGKGKMYIHCWHGLHASGYVAAIALRQFCGLSSEQAVNYWNSNVPPKLQYPKVQAMIRQFTLDPNLEISPERKAKICPKNL